MTSQLSLDMDIEELPSSPLDARVSRIALQESVERLVTSVIYGAKSSEFWAKRSPNGSWERTCQDSLALNLDGSSGEWSMAWPRWGIASDGACMELQILEQSTEDTESSLLPTPRCHKVEGVSSENWRPTLFQALLPTPRANDPEKPGNFDPTNKRNGLPGAVVMLGTPLGSLRGQGRRGTLLTDMHQYGQETGDRGALSPLFVEAMMGFPAGWTDLEHSETP